MRRKFFKPLALAGILAGLLAAAACLGQPHPVKTRFALSIPELEAPYENVAGRRTLLIGAVSAAAGYDGPALVYRLGPDRFERDFYNEFLAPPARLLAEAEARFLTGASRRLRATLAPGLTLADYGLETHIQALYGDYSQSPPRAVTVLRFALNDLRPASPRILLDKTYACDRPLAGKAEPADLTTAFSLCLAQILGELAPALDSEIRGR